MGALVLYRYKFNVIIRYIVVEKQKPRNNLIFQRFMGFFKATFL